jgi:hypothetical protein
MNVIFLTHQEKSQGQCSTTKPDNPEWLADKMSRQSEGSMGPQSPAAGCFQNLFIDFPFSESYRYEKSGSAPL